MARGVDVADCAALIGTIGMDGDGMSLSLHVAADGVDSGRGVANVSHGASS